MSTPAPNPVAVTEVARSSEIADVRTTVGATEGAFARVGGLVKDAVEGIRRKSREAEERVRIGVIGAVP